MRRSQFASAMVLAVVVGLGLSVDAQAASKDKIDQLVIAAKKEGSINFQAPSLIGPKAAQLLGAAFNKKYGFNITLNYFPSSSFTKDTAKVISQTALGVAPEWDIMVLTENNHAELAEKKLHL